VKPAHLRWAAPGPYEVLFSTRVGGVSGGPFASLNLGRLTDDDPGNVEVNRRILCSDAGADVGRLTFNRQIHGATVREARDGERGEPGDGLWSDERGLPLLAMTADCLPVALVRTNGKPALALLHAGRLGVLGGVLEAGVDALGGGPLAAAVGPAIGPCCYEVGDDIRAAYVERFGDGVVRGRKLDLWTSAERILRDVGVDAIERLDLCTSCHPELFFSHRRDGGKTGRQGVIGYVA
jgi:YfiH family protein